MIITIDPSGTNITACFLFENWTKWEFINIEDKNWLNQVKKLESLLKNKKPQLVAYETSSYLKKSYMNKHFIHLLKVVAGLEIILDREQIENKSIDNKLVANLEDLARSGKIKGLIYQKEQGLIGRPKSMWYFKEKLLNEHEKDALLVFYFLWVKNSQREWPWS